jgi:hypothetical protein
MSGRRHLRFQHHPLAWEVLIFEGRSCRASWAARSRRLVHWPRHALPLPSLLAAPPTPNAPSKRYGFPTGCTMPPLRPLTPPPAAISFDPCPPKSSQHPPLRSSTSLTIDDLAIALGVNRARSSRDPRRRHPVAPTHDL